MVSAVQSKCSKKNPWGKNIMPLNVIQLDRITIGLDSSAADVKCYSPKIFKAK